MVVLERTATEVEEALAAGPDRVGQRWRSSFRISKAVFTGLRIRPAGSVAGRYCSRPTCTVQVDAARVHVATRKLGASRSSG